MKNKLIAALALLFSASTSAIAADLAPITKAPLAASPLSDWSGFYLGVHGGYGWTSNSSTADQIFVGITFQPLFVPNAAGWAAGGHFGYNWQYGQAVAGIEADFDGADIKKTLTIATPAAALVTGSITTSPKTDLLASARGRLGYLITPSLLLYGTGGAAWGHTEISQQLSTVAPADFRTQSTTLNQFGWVAGVGGEAKWDHWLVRLEYLHYDFARAQVNFNLNNYNFVFLNSNVRTSVDVVRGGVGFKF